MSFYVECCAIIGSVCFDFHFHLFTLPIASVVYFFKNCLLHTILFSFGTDFLIILPKWQAFRWIHILYIFFANVRFSASIPRKWNYFSPASSFSTIPLVVKSLMSALKLSSFHSRASRPMNWWASSWRRSRATGMQRLITRWPGTIRTAVIRPSDTNWHSTTWRLNDSSTRLISPRPFWPVTPTIRKSGRTFSTSVAPLSKTDLSPADWVHLFSTLDAFALYSNK